MIKGRLMKVRFYGCRGSTPVCERPFQEYGGNTTCVLLTFDNGRIAILDAGSGLRNLGKDLIASGHRQQGTIFIGLSHFHLDHIQGFPFFAPAYDRSRHFTLCAFGCGASTKNIRGIFAGQMQQEYFPVSLDEMGASFAFHEPAGDGFVEGETRVTSYRHNHPGGAFTYRIESRGKVLVFCTDIEHGEMIDPKIVELSEGADLLIHDAQYTPDELPRKRGWGHSSWEQAVDVARQAGVKRLALTHHDPDHDDAFLRKIDDQCRRHFSHAFLARDTMEIEF